MPTEFTALCLGNPGERYRKTRHNAGFFVAERVAEALSCRLRKRLLAPYRSCYHPPLLLVTPLTYMNRSGDILPAVVRRYPKATGRMVIVYDQMDLPPGAIRLKRGGGAGGHRGVASVLVNCNEQQEVLKLSVGIGRPAEDMSVTEYVLSPPEKSEEVRLEEACLRAADVLLRLRSENADSVMNEVNRRDQVESQR